MTVNTGTYDLSALLSVRNTSAEKFGMDNIAEVLAADLTAHNANVATMFTDFCEATTDVQRIYGSSTDGEMVEVDEYGLGPTQSPRVGSQVAFPLRKFQYNTGFTSDFFKMKTPADVAQVAVDAQLAHLKMLRKTIAKAIFGATNYSWVDKYGLGISLGIKRLVNADSALIPGGPNGEAFDGATHTHYNANATLTNAALLDTLQDVIEHGHGSDLRIAINRSNLSAVMGLADFKAYVDPRLVLGTQANQPGQSLDVSRLDNVAVGLFNGAEVFVRPWVPANYAFAYSAGDPRKPVVIRRPVYADGTVPGLALASKFEQYPLMAEAYESYFGAGVFTRTNGAALYFAAGAWADPTIS